MIAAALVESLEAELGERIVCAHSVTGGDINEAFALELASRERVFVKTHGGADPQMFPAEAHGLEWLRAAGALRIPRVVAVSGGGEGRPAFLALEWLESAPRGRDFDESLGRSLAVLHRAGAPAFGLERDNFIGRLPQVNRPAPSWAEFYRERRLAPQLALAVEQRRLPPTLRRACERLLDHLDRWVGPTEPPARLHGDLWGGNLHVDERGRPVLIDPAAYGGHREMDLAMMRLFGGFGARVFSAYAEAYPLAPGHEERVPLFQLYPLLVHVNLFGGGYVASVARAIERYG